MANQHTLFLKGSHKPLNLSFCYSQGGCKYFCGQSPILTKKCQHFLLICPDI